MFPVSSLRVIKVYADNLKLLYELYMTFLTLRKAVGHAYALRHSSSAPLLHVLYL